MSPFTQSRRRFTALAGLVALFVLAGSASAFAATLSVDGGVLRYTGSGGTISNVQFDETDPNEVTVRRDTGGSGSDNDPISPGTGCVENNPMTFVCTGVTSVFADASDLDDELDASSLTTIPATLNGGPGDDLLDGGAAGDTLNGGAGDDFAEGGEGNDTVNGDDGRDFVYGNDGDDTVNGGGGDDFFVFGGDGNDTVSGGDGDDGVQGGRGNDTVNGDAGEDGVGGDDGNDTVNGGEGDDFLFNDFTVRTNAPPGFVQEPDTDVYNGGSGFDRLVTSASSDDGTTTTPLDLRVTLNDVADDGAAGENDNVRSDVEAVSSQTQVGPGGAGGNDSLTGNAGTNDLAGGRGNDTLDGGLGNDVLAGGSGDDTINAQDGFADFVACGPGNDTANVDTLDTVTDCETVNRRDVGNANEDRPPTIALTSPAPNATLQTRTPTVLTANVADDKGIAQVLYVVNGRIVCTATAAPYSCSYQPTGADVGRTQITAIAIDSSQQTATDLRAVNVGLFAPRRFSLSLSPSRDLSRPYRFRATGRISLPPSVTAAQGCRDGVVSVQVKAGRKTISTRRVNIRRNCTFSSTVSFTDRRRFGRATRLKFTARFTGNKVLSRSASASRFGRVRR